MPAAARLKDPEANKDGSVCDTKVDYCTVEGVLRADFNFTSDSDCQWRIDIDYGDGTTETGRITGSHDETGFPIVHEYGQRRTYELTITLSEGFSPSGFPPGCGNYTECHVVQYPKAPRKGAERTLGRLVGKVSSREKAFVLGHEGPGTLIVGTDAETRWGTGLKSFKDLKSGLSVSVEVRFDGKRWVAGRVDRARLTPVPGGECG